MAAALVAAWAEVREDAKEEVVAPVAIMAQLLALGVALEEVLVLAPEACLEGTAVGMAATSNNNLVSRPFYFKQREEYRRQNCTSCE